MLNLDDICEDIDLKEDDSTECILCTHTNHSYLDHMHHTLSCTTSKTNLYTILHDAFNKQMNLLKKQGLEHHTITKDALVRHYEYHVISLERAVMEDVRLVKQMMKGFGYLKNTQVVIMAQMVSIYLLTIKEKYTQFLL